MTKPKRDQSLRVRISTEELAMLRALADRTGVSGSDVIRLAIRTGFEATLGKKKAK